MLLRRAGAALPERLLALLEVESGLNDPMSVFLTLLLLRLIAEPGSVGSGEAARMFLEEMAGGAVIGLAGGWILAQLLKRLALEGSLAPVLVLTGGLAVFGLAQLLGTSGFLATYLAAIVTGATRHRARQEVEHFFEGMAWLAQIVLFLMLGLLVTPHDLPPYSAGRDHRSCGADPAGTPGCCFRLPHPLRVHDARECVRLLGRIAWGSADLPQHHTSARRPQPR